MTLLLLLLLFDCKEESTSSSTDKQRLSVAAVAAGAVVSIVEDDMLCTSECSISLVDDETGLTDNTPAGSFTSRAGESLGVEEAVGLLTDAFFTVKEVKCYFLTYRNHT